MKSLPVLPRFFLSLPGWCLLAALVCPGLIHIPAGAEEKPDDSPPCTSAELTQVMKKDMDRIVNGVGTLEADQKVLIRTEITGTIETVLFQEGAEVSNGEELVLIDDTRLRNRMRAARAAVKEARATFSNAARTLRRQQELSQRDLTSQDDLDQARTARETAAARVERLTAELAMIQEDLTDATITAPFAGIVGQRLVDVGNWINAGTQLTTLVKTDPLRMAFSLPERYLDDIKPGQEVTITTAAGSDRTFNGRIFFISPQVNESTRSFLVKASIDNQDNILKPGGYASVSVIVETHRDAAVIPEEALIPTRTGYKIFVVKDQVAHLKEVTPGLRRPGLVEITAGLSPGETVVRSGHIALHDGSRVCPSENSSK
ncbi:MAG: efflux RND transporter periplasmic adaptor subunit [Desulfosudaceae bacterium]